MFNLYWVSYIVQETETSRPWLCALSEGVHSYEKALELIEFGKKKHRLLSAWVNVYDESKNKTTVFHECYLS